MGKEAQGDDLSDPNLLNDGLDGGAEDGEDGGNGHDGDDVLADAGDADGGGKDGNDEDRGFEIELEGDDGDGLGDPLADDEDGTEIQTKDKDEPYGKKVRARIERERRIARDARAQAANERAARIKAEAISLKVQREALETTEAAIDAMIPNVRAQLKQAKEDGKTDDEIKHQETLATLNQRKAGLEGAKRHLDEQEKQLRGDAAAAAGPNSLAQEWMRRNPWFKNERYAEATAIARGIDATMSNEGWDKNDPEYYRELTRRVSKRAPELQRFFQQRSGGKPQPRRDPTGGVIRRPSGGGEQQTRGVVRLTREDQAVMRQFGLDPTNKAHVKAFAEQKRGGANAQ